MSRHAGLASRVKRVERHRRAKRPKPPIVFMVQPEAAGEVTGLATITSGTVGRKPWEPLAALTARAAASTGYRILIASYAPPAPPPAPTAVPAVVLPGNPEPFPWHRSGIGIEDERFRGWWQPKAGD